MKLPYSTNILAINGLDGIDSACAYYLAVLKMLHTQFPKGYFEADIFLNTLYGDSFPNKQELCKSKLKRYNRIDWFTTDGSHTLRSIFSFLHFAFANFPNECLDEVALLHACKDLEEWAKEE